MTDYGCDSCGTEILWRVVTKTGSEPGLRCEECMGCTCLRCYEGKHLHGLDESDGTCPVCPVHQVNVPAPGAAPKGRSDG